MQKVPLTQGLFALVDDEDFERVSQFKWCVIRSHGIPYARHTDYAQGRRKPKRVWMHKFVLNTEQPVDHIEGDTLDNRKEKLRLCTRNQNAQNRIRNRTKKASKFKGVFIRNDGKCRARPWYVMIWYDAKPHYVGCFKTDEEAARAYDAEAVKRFGAFARPNCYPES